MPTVISKPSTTKGQKCVLVFSDDHELIEKSCSLCLAIKSLSEFHVDPTTGNGYKAACKMCCRERDKKRYHANPQHYRDKVTRSRYQLATGQLEAMYKSQQGKCLICDKKKTLVVDHDHNNGKVRGLLCQACNTALGKFGEDIDILTSAIAYLINTEKEG